MPERPVAGIDVSKHFSDMCILSPDNTVHSTVHIYHDLTSMSRSLIALQAATDMFDAKPVLIMESTAHYHRIIAEFMQNAGYEVLVINPMQSGALKNINIRRIKNDKTDAHRIALLYRMKMLKTTNKPCTVLSDIRDFSRQRSDLMGTHTAYVNRLTSLLDQVFPGYDKIFNRTASKSSLGILKSFPTPDAVLTTQPEELAEIISKCSRRGINTPYVQNRTSALLETASKASVFAIKRDSYALLITTVADILQDLRRHMDMLEKQVKALAKHDCAIWEDIQLLDSIPGIGAYAAAVLRAEIGDFSIFRKPKQLVAFFGLDPSTRQSGKFVGTKTRLSKRGSPYARALLDVCAQAAIHPVFGKEPTNPVLAAYYASKVETKAPKVVKCAVMRKMVEIMFAVLRDQKPFELRWPEEHIQRMHKKAVSTAA